MQGIEVGRHARHEHAGLLPLEEVETETHQVPEHPRAQVPQERLADVRDTPDDDTTEDEGKERTPEVQPGGQVERADVAVQQPGIDTVPDEGRAREQRAGLSGHE